MTHDGPRADLARMAVGLIVLATGLTLLANQLDWIHVHDIGNLWPLILIGIGISSTANAPTLDKRRSGLLLTFTGCWLLIASLELFGMGYHTAWPLALVAVGLARVLAPSSRRPASGGWFLIGVGAFFLVWTLRWWDFDMDDAWPLLLIAAGLFMIFRAFEARSGSGDNMEVNDGQS